jgi:hypothetical protein
MAEPLLILADRVTPRLRYIVQLIFGELLGVKAVVTTNHSAFTAHLGPRLTYRKQPMPGIPGVVPAGFLERTDIVEIDPGFGYHRDEVVLFPVPGHPALPLDVFSAAFYLVSRYEEYLPFIPDGHGRFPAINSVAHRMGFLNRPLVNIWVNWLAEYVQQGNPGLTWNRPSYRFVSTVDIDNSFAYRGKGWFRVAGGLAQDVLRGRVQNARHRLRVLLQQEQDPYDTFLYQYQIQEEVGFESIYFLLFAQFGRFDRNLPMHSTLLRKSIKFIADFTRVGLHPSYGSHASPKVLAKELSGLSEVLNRDIDRSRQHFLKFTMPHTFRQLIQLGIHADYSMGYPNQPGFRAGICHPFPFYDLENEAETLLRIHPLIFLETTFIDHLGMGAEEAWPTMKALIDQVKQHGGECVTVWHNRTFSEAEPAWAGWNQLYRTMTQYAARA